MYVETLAGLLTMTSFSTQIFPKKLILIFFLLSNKKANGKTEFDILGFLYRQVVKSTFILNKNNNTVTT